MSQALFDIEVPGIQPVHRGKVRSVYECAGELVIVASDRISAYDVVLPTAIPDKGRILTQISAFWFRSLAEAGPHHYLSVGRADLPAPFCDLPDLEGRAMLCRKTEPIRVECIVRGYLAGSGWQEYRERGTLNGEALPAGLEPGSRLDPPRFTPTTKVEEGHDEPLAIDEFRRQLGDETAAELERRSVSIFAAAGAICESARLVLADTKLEFGRVGNEILLIDECLSPDASRFWDAESFGHGVRVPFDKQFVRDYLDECGWDHRAPGPVLQAAVVASTRKRYIEALSRLMGEKAARASGFSPVETV